MKKFLFNSLGQSLVELLVVIGLAAVLFPALLTGFAATRNGRPQQEQRLEATAYLKEGHEALRIIRFNGWANLANGTYHPVVSGSTWVMTSGAETINNNFTRQIVISDVYRDAGGNIASVGGTLDNATKKATVTVSWSNPFSTSVSSITYLSRYKNASYVETTASDFSAGVLSNTQVTNDSGGEIKLSNNNKAKWCSPALSPVAIDLPDGPPVAVSAFANATSAAIPNKVFVGTAPTATSSIKLAFVDVTADTEDPVASLRGTFTLDSSKYSPGTFPSGIGLNNSFRTNDVKHFISGAGKMYALLATDKPDREVVVVQVNNGTSDSFQDPTNKIYKYWTFFNTKQYQGDNRSTPNQDQAPFGYGGVSLAVLGSRGYLVSGGYLYVFDLSNIDSKSTSSGLDQLGCRIQLDGYDCQVGNGTDRKYSSGQTGTTWGDTTPPAHNDCSDGGNVELYADNSIFPISVGGNTYVYVAVGAGTNPEFNIVNVTNVPTSGTNPTISSNSCGRISGGNNSWKRISSLDFNSDSGTEEAANSVYGSSDGTRAYISSNGGIDADNNGSPDSSQFYIINTSNKSNPAFLSGTPSTGAQSGYYNGTGANAQLYPRRSLTVLNGQRVVLVGKDGTSDGNNAQEYQVLDNTSEATPAFCGGLNFDQGFNDLVSVSEADTDNFVYMVANTNEKQLKIIQGGPDSAVYVSSGNFESQLFNAGQDVMFNRLFSTVNIPSQTTIQYQVAIAKSVGGSCSAASYTYAGPDGTPNTFFATASALPRSSDGTGYENAGQCMKYKVFMTSSTQQQTPVLYDFGVNYSP